MLTFSAVHEVWVKLLALVSLRRLLTANIQRLTARLVMSVRAVRRLTKDEAIISSSWMLPAITLLRTSSH